MRRFLVEGGRFNRTGRPRLGAAAAALGLAVTLAILFSYSRGRPATQTRDLPGAVVPAPAGAQPATQAPAGAGGGTVAAGPAQPGRPPDQAAQPTAEALPAPLPGTMTRPVDGAVIVRHGWTYSRTMDDWRWHPGIDMASPAGAPVKAAAAGRVHLVRQGKEWGWEVVIEHGGGISTRYAGCGSVAVRRGQQVGEGEAIASVGQGALAEVENGVHLHFEVLVAGEPVDPLRYLK